MRANSSTHLRVFSQSEILPHSGAQIAPATPNAEAMPVAHTSVVASCSVRYVVKKPLMAMNAASSKKKIIPSAQSIGFLRARLKSALPATWSSSV